MLEVSIKKRLQHVYLDIAFSLGHDIMALVGKSGAGKTTILNCLAGIIEPDEGEIRLRGEVLYDKEHQVPVKKRKIGYLFQDYALFPHMTVWENIAYGMKDEAFTLVLMDDLQIAELANKYPHEVSGGEKQRTALIRGLATEPELLLLDEPFSSLDDETREIGHKELLSIHEKWEIPVIFVTHSKWEAEKIADVQYLLEDGRLEKK